MAKPRSISKKTRFEVFKRDSFTCQYCGEKAPNAVLRVDHIKPVAKGGTSGILNLITACHSCNAGKSDRELSDSSVVTKAHDQAQMLQERREQIAMLSQWHVELASLDEETVDAACHLFEILTGGYTWRNQEGRSSLKKMIGTYGLDEVLTSIRIAAKAYLSWDREGVLDPASVNLAASKVSGILFNRKKYSGPDGAAVAYALNIIKRHHYVYVAKLRTIESLCRKALTSVTTDDLVAMARAAESADDFIYTLEDVTT